ncbi:hypothetical protein V6N13_097825 [Hibiscus sabdariffa]
METRGSTTILNNHLKTCLKKPQGNIVDLKQSKLAFSKTTSDSEKGEGFKIFLYIACPRYHLPSRYTVRSDCLDLFNSMKRLMKNSFGKDTSKICLTTDTWTSLKRVSYMVLTAHWIDDEWMLQKRIINFYAVESIYTMLKVAEKYERAFDSYARDDRSFFLDLTAGDGVPTFDD